MVLINGLTIDCIHAAIIMNFTFELRNVRVFLVVMSNKMGNVQSDRNAIELILRAALCSLIITNKLSVYSSIRFLSHLSANTAEADSFKYFLKIQDPPGRT